MTTYFYFQSSSKSELDAFTDDPTGDKLPAENGPWTLVREVSSDDDWTHTTTRGVVAAGVAANGFVLLAGEGSGGQSTSSKPMIESDRVEGTAVYAPNGHHIGTIKRLMIDKVSGQVAYAVMTFGGFLGLGQSGLPGRVSTFRPTRDLAVLCRWRPRHMQREPDR